MKKAIFIFSAILIGCLFPAGRAFTYLIRYHLMIMLFFAFLGISLDLSLFNKNHFKVLFLNIILPTILYFIVLPFSDTLALVAFVIGIVPTAAAGPVIADLMNVSVGKVTVSVILTTPIIALALPFILTYVIGTKGEIALLDLVLPVLSIVFVPLILSQFFQKVTPKIATQLQQFGWISFFLFLINIIIGCGNASHFVQTNQSFSINELLLIILVVILVCVLQFQIGARLSNQRAGSLIYSLALGRKNTMLALWLSLTFFNPLVALGPIFYVVVQNIYNSVQLWQLDKEPIV
ncbi:MAG: hypothetical protein AAF960_10770 [Bacteroidota bacterium]